MTKLDPRRHAFRADLAAASLKDQVRAPRYADGEIRQVCAPQIPIRTAPRFDAPLATEGLCGELLTLYDAKDGWGWVQLHGDGYVGYTTLDGITALPDEPTHKVAARLTYVYPAPDMKQPPFMRLSFSSAVRALGAPEGKFVETSRGGFVFGDHLVGAHERVRDFVRVAERFVGAPYLWGGKTATGIDCSGLVQVSLHAAGLWCPRDSDMQAAEIGEAIDPANLDAIHRGDLLFWRGHVALAQSADWIVHASGFHMEVVVEPVRRAIERIGESHGPLLAIKRPVIEQAAARRPQVEAEKKLPAQAALQQPAPVKAPPATVTAQAKEQPDGKAQGEARPQSASPAAPQRPEPNQPPADPRAQAKPWRGFSMRPVPGAEQPAQAKQEDEAPPPPLPEEAGAAEPAAGAAAAAKR